MNRFGQEGGGRFDVAYELEGVFDATEQDLQSFVGQVVPWYVLDRAASVEDPTYDVGGNLAVGGRRWKPPLYLPVLSVIRTQGSYDASIEGFYVTDFVHVSVSVRQAENAGLRDLEDRPDGHLVDRFVWDGTVFTPTRIQERGLVQRRFTVIGIDAAQVNPDELVNDPDFRQYAQPPA